MIIIKKISVTVSFLVVTLFTSGQSFQKEIKPENYRAIPWTLGDGLSYNTFHEMIKDTKGFLWIGSHKGDGELCRFDGLEFKKYPPNPLKSGEINTAVIYSFQEDSLGNIWIGTDKGLTRYDTKADTFLNILSSSRIIPFWATKDEVLCYEESEITAYNVNTLLRQTMMKGLKQPKNKDHFNKIGFFDKNSNSVWKLSFENEKGALEQIAKDGRIVPYRIPCLRKSIGHPRHNAEAFKYDPGRNSIWINSGEGLLEFSLIDREYRQHDALKGMGNLPEYDRDVGIDIDINGKVWFATRPNGVFIYDPQTELARPLFVNADMNRRIGEYNFSIYCDREGITWISYYDIKGINQLLPYDPPVRRYTADTKKPGSLSNNSIHNLIAAPEGKIWIGTDDGLNILDPDVGKFQVLREKDLPGFQGKSIIPLHIDSIHQKALISAGSGAGTEVIRFYEMDLKSQKCRPVNLRHGGSKSDTFFMVSPYMVKSYKGGLLICSESHGIFELKENNLYADLLVPFSHVTGAVILADDNYLFFEDGSPSPVASNFTFKNENGKWIKIAHFLDTLNWSEILYDKKDNSFWVAFRFEIIHYSKDFQKIRGYMLGNRNYGLVELLSDDAGNIWFVNILKQICRLDTASGIISNLSETDGYLKQNYSWSTTGIKDSRGNLYFGDRNPGTANGGLDRIFPERFSSSAKSNVYLRNLTINQKPLSLKIGINSLEELSLSHNENLINIETGIIDFYAKGNGNIRYKLEGPNRNEDWQYGPAYSTIRYDGLAPGNYRLILQASNASHEFNSPQKVLSINISPAFWNTWWFRIAAILFIGSMIYFIIRWRLQQRFRLRLERSERETQIAEMRQKTAELQQQATELEMQALRAQMNPHFIFNSLNSINRFILQNNRAQASEYLTKFSKLVRLILQNSQASLIPLEVELEALGLYLDLEAVRFDHRFDYKISVSKDLDIDVLKVPPLIIQPYAENAIWHGLMHKEEKGHLDIEITQEKDHLFFKIADNGIGRKAAAELSSKSATKHKSMGLKITADRIAMLQSSNGQESPVSFIDLVSPDGRAAGTEVIIKMPVIYD